LEWSQLVLVCVLYWANDTLDHKQMARLGEGSEMNYLVELLLSKNEYGTLTEITENDRREVASGIERLAWDNKELRRCAEVQEVERYAQSNREYFKEIERLNDVVIRLTTESARAKEYHAAEIADLTAERDGALVDAMRWRTVRKEAWVMQLEFNSWCWATEIQASGENDTTPERFDSDVDEVMKETP
jgi:hypothetical protein